MAGSELHTRTALADLGPENEPAAREGVLGEVAVWLLASRLD